MGQVLEFKDVVKRYWNARSKRWEVVLDRISLVVEAGEFISLVGPSGSGKTRLLNLVGGFEVHNEGEVLLEGKPIGGPDRDRGIVTQQYSLFPNLTVLDNVAFGLDLEEFTILGRWTRFLRYRDARKRHRRQAMEYLAQVKLDQHAYKYPHQLSGGMRQRVAIAQALIMKPKVLMMDEPFGALDPEVREELQAAMIQTHENERNTIVFVTHDLEEAAYLATRVLVLMPDRAALARGEGGKARIARDLRAPDGPRKDRRDDPEYWKLIKTIRTTLSA